MNPINRINSFIDLAIEHAKHVLLSIVALFTLNCLSFFVLAAYFPQHDSAIITALLLIIVWPILVVAYGILRLRTGITTDEETVKRRREATLRYFGIFTGFSWMTLLFIWRFRVVRFDFDDFRTVMLLIILGILLVFIARHWSKYSNTGLSMLINKAPIHYLFGAVALLIGIISYLAYDDLKIYNNESSLLRQTRAMYGVTFFLSFFSAFGSFVLGYLRPSEEVKELTLRESPSRKSEDLNEFEPTEIFPSFNARRVLDRLVSKVETTNSRLETLLNQPLNGARTFDPSEVVTERVESIRGRLTGELKDLTKRGNLNLTIGILTTLGAISALFWGLIATQPNPQETHAVGLLRHYLPRLSFAIFIEVFSFFFLRLYKNSLEDIKYYHNELTNLDSRLLALEIAVSTQQSDALTPILLGLLSTDRNFVLKSGASTVELEKVKTEQQYLRSLIDTVSKKIPDFGTAEKN